MENFSKEKYLQSKKGEAIYILCARFGYRGIVQEVGENSLLLSNPYMIFEENSYTNLKPKEEYVIPSDLLIDLTAIESICQPTWCFYGYEKK